MKLCRNRPQTFIDDKEDWRDLGKKMKELGETRLELKKLW